MFNIDDIKEPEKEIQEIEKSKALPWDLLWPGTEYVSEEIYNERYETCLNCEFMSKMSPKVCKKCKCWMRLKTAYAHSECPEGKWLSYNGKANIKEKPKTEEEADLIDRTSALSMIATSIFKKQEKSEEMLDKKSDS